MVNRKALNMSRDVNYEPEHYNGVLNAVEKMYYKQVRSGFGYELVREPIEEVI